jgi:CheY-like chemotaxis protein/GGDEF domain-containing protein
MSRILVVHSSKVIRATLARYLAPHFETIEALDGESAWQTLVLDHDIIAVIAGPDIPRLSGLDLLERLRRNRLQRLKGIPFYLFGSEDRLAEIRATARERGVTDFILNGMGKWDILPFFLPKTAPQAAGDRTPPGTESGAGAPARTSGASGYFRDAGVLSPSLFEEGVRRMFARPGDTGAVLVFGLDLCEAPLAALDATRLAHITGRLARLVQTKIGQSDCIGQYGPGRFAIATRTSGREACEGFARRVAKSVHAARIVVGGQRLAFTLTSGTASRPEDGALSGEALLSLALQRQEAQHPAEKIPTAP